MSERAKEPYVLMRCLFPEAARLFALCYYLPQPLRRLWALAVGWLMWWQLDEGQGWQHIMPEVVDEDDDDDDEGDGFPLWTPMPQLGGAW